MFTLSIGGGVFQVSAIHANSRAVEITLQSQRFIDQHQRLMAGCVSVAHHDHSSRVRWSCVVAPLPSVSAPRNLSRSTETMVHASMDALVPSSALMLSSFGSTMFTVDLLVGVTQGASIRVDVLCVQ